MGELLGGSNPLYAQARRAAPAAGASCCGGRGRGGVHGGRLLRSPLWEEAGGYLNQNLIISTNQMKSLIKYVGFYIRHFLPPLFLSQAGKCGFLFSRDFAKTCSMNEEAIYTTRGTPGTIG